MKAPDLAARKMHLDLQYTNKLLGTSFTAAEVKTLLEKMRYGATVSGKKITVLVPAYRTDVLHQMDLVEDVAIAYGYNNFKPELPKISTVGKRDPFSLFCGSVRELAIGFGFTEIMTLIMTNERDQFTRMGLPIGAAVTTSSPVSTEHSIARTWLLPSLCSVLEKNKNREYPQRVFEIGYCIDPSGKDAMKLAGTIAHSKTNFSEMKSVVCGLLENLGKEDKVEAIEHASFIPGRCASLPSGYFGEIHPAVLDNFSLEVPVTAFELNLKTLFS
jgi:phenylalanyl-tRNA synthetase beta chain